MVVRVGGPREPTIRRPYRAAIGPGRDPERLSRRVVTQVVGGIEPGDRGLGRQLGVPGFYHNTGEGGLSPYHLKPGGDLVWQVGTGYFSCRSTDGGFDPGRCEAGPRTGASPFASRATLSSISKNSRRAADG